MGGKNTSEWLCVEVVKQNDLGKLRVMLMPGSNHGLPVGKGSEKGSMLVTEPCGCLENTFFWNLHFSVVVGRRF